MKHHLNRALSVVALLMLSLSTWASGEVTISVVPANAGTVTSNISGGVCTLTATPAQGYYLTAANLQAVTILNGEAMQAPRRAIPINDGVLAISATNADADPSGVTTYTFTMPDENFTVEVTAEFQQRISISNANITLAQSSYTYDGTAKEPAVSQVMVNNTALTANDYTVSYSDNINIGTSATVTLTGQGMYLGTATTTFTISAKTITSDMITLTSNSLVYNAEANIPEVTVTDQIGGENVRLSAGTDFTVSYQQVVGETASAIDDPIDVGNYNVVVTGKGNYTGSATKSFAITKAPLSLTVSLDGWTYGATANTPTVSGNVGQGGASYYYKVKGAEDETYAAYTGTQTLNAGDYTIKVVVAETDNYASGSATADFTIAKAVLPVGGENGLKVTLAGWTYGATANTPTVTGNVGEGVKTFYYKSKNADDETYAAYPGDQALNAGEYTIKVEVAETANYESGSATANFTIAQADMSLVSVSYEDLDYNGAAQQLITVNNVPDGAIVKYFCQKLTDPNEMICYPNEDGYSTTVPSKTDAGYYGIIYKIEETNNYKAKDASETYYVKIEAAEISEVTIDKTSMEYKGAAQTVTITSVKAGKNGSLDVPSAGYTVTLNDVAVTGDIQATAVGEYVVAVTGKGNYTGTKSATFTIVNKMLAVTENDFHNHWMTYYSDNGDVDIPVNSNIGAFVATGVANNAVTVTQISNIPEGVAVLLNNTTETTTTNVFGTDVKGNLLVHATNDKQVDPTEGDFYGLYNGAFMRITDKSTIPAGKNYLLIPNAVNVNTGAPKLNIVFDNEANMTGIDEVRSKMEDVRGDVYDLMGRKVQKPSKKGLYIQKGRKVVINK